MIIWFISSTSGRHEVHMLEVFRERNPLRTCAFIPIILSVCINDYMYMY